MATNNNQTLETKDVFAVYLENINKIFTGIKHSVPQYHQSITNIQQSYLNACENFINTSIKLQQEYAKKTGIKTNLPEVTQRIIQHTTEEFVKAVSIQNQVTFATIDATQQNIKTMENSSNLFNEYSKSFVDMIQSLFSTFITKK